MVAIDHEKRKLHQPYALMLCVYALFLAAALLLDSPGRIGWGLIQILTSRSVLITDYMAVGGVGATLVNAAVVGLFSVAMLVSIRAKPNGSIIMALWLSVGFAMFGKNLFNMLPLTFGVWLYSRVRREPFINFSLTALLSATLSPAVSGICFHPELPRQVSMPLGIGVGIMAGLLFPALSAFTVRVHGGYDLYNMGFAGGLISTFVVAGLASIGVDMPRADAWSTGNNPPLAALLYLLTAAMMAYGILYRGRPALPPYRKMLRHTGRVVTDLYVLYGNGVLFNMGLLGALATTLLLLLGADLNGATLCGIFTIMGFGAFGKHLRNVTPVVAGALLSAFINKSSATDPANVLAILFSTGLAPIAGQFGPAWGLLAGFLHVNLITHIGFLNSGLNLYNNGYAAGFVALLLLPVILAFQREEK